MEVEETNPGVPDMSGSVRTTSSKYPKDTSKANPPSSVSSQAPS